MSKLNIKDDLFLIKALLESNGVNDELIKDVINSINKINEKILKEIVKEYVELINGENYREHFQEFSVWLNNLFSEVVK